jgi:pentatricopeptide repeat protein
MLCALSWTAASAALSTDSSGLAASLRVQNQAGQWQATLELFRAAKAGGADRSSYTEAIVAHGRLRQSDKALNVFREMQDAGLTPNVVSCAQRAWGPTAPLPALAHAPPTPRFLCADTATIAACGSQSHWPIALSLFSDMQADGVTPDAYAINAVRCIPCPLPPLPTATELSAAAASSSSRGAGDQRVRARRPVGGGRDAAAGDAGPWPIARPRHLQHCHRCGGARGPGKESKRVRE